jgi:hypothetical protein
MPRGNGLCVHLDNKSMNREKIAVQKSRYNPELASTILTRVSEGETLRQVARDEGVPESSIREWIRSDVDGLAARYSQARAMQVDSWADEIITVAYDLTIDPAEKRVRCDQLRWLLSKLSPKRYGERLLVAGDADSPVQLLHQKVDLTALFPQQLDALEHLADALIAKQG